MFLIFQKSVTKEWIEINYYCLNNYSYAKFCMLSITNFKMINEICCDTPWFRIITFGLVLLFWFDHYWKFNFISPHVHQCWLVGLSVIILKGLEVTLPCSNQRICVYKWCRFNFFLSSRLRDQMQGFIQAKHLLLTLISSWYALKINEWWAISKGWYTYKVL